MTIRFEKPFPTVTILLVLLLSIGIYGMTLTYEFHYDDIAVILQNRSIQEIDITKIWKEQLHPSRFIAFCSFSLNYYFNQLQPAGYRLVNIIIHALNALWVWWLICLIFQTPQLSASQAARNKEGIALLTALLFLAHPLQTETVTYITQRFTSLVAFFYLASLCFYAKARLEIDQRNKYMYLGVCLLTAVMAMFTKQTAMTLPLSFLLFESSFFPKQTRTKGKDRAVIIYGAVVLLLLMIVPALYRFDVGSILGLRVASGSHEGDYLTPGTYLLTQFRVILTYVRLLLFPFGQRLIYDYPMSQSIFDLPTFFSFVAVLLMLAWAFMSYAKDRVIFFGIIWFLLTLSVESSVIVIKYVIFEHRLYLPSIGIFLIASLVIFNLFTDERKRLIFCVGIIAFLAALSLMRNQAWKDGVALWSDNARRSPDHPKVHYNLGYEQLIRGHSTEAIKSFDKAIALDPQYFEAYNNRSQAYYNEGRYELALADADQAIAINPHSADAFNNRGTARRMLNDLDKANEDFTRALAIEPNHLAALINRGMTYGNQRRYDLAISDLKKAIQLHPRSEKAYSVLGAIYLAMGNTDEAIANFREAKRINPRFIDAYNNLAQTFQQKGELLMALNEYSLALVVAPQDKDLTMKRAFLLSKLKHFDDALNDYTKLLQWEPANAGIYTERGKVYYQRQEYSKALDDFEQAIRFNNNDAQLYFFRGLCRFELGRYEEALVDMKKASDMGFRVDQIYFTRINDVIRKKSLAGQVDK